MIDGLELRLIKMHFSGLKRNTPIVSRTQPEEMVVCILDKVNLQVPNNDTKKVNSPLRHRTRSTVTLKSP